MSFEDLAGGCEAERTGGWMGEWSAGGFRKLLGWHREKSGLGDGVKERESGWR